MSIEAVAQPALKCSACRHTAGCMAEDEHAASDPLVSQAEHLLKKLMDKGGPDPQDYDTIDAALARLYSAVEQGAMPARAVCRLRKVMAPTLSLDSMQGFAFRKPKGYAGDYEIIDRIYQQRKSPEPHLAKWDEYFHGHDAPTAVRNRKTYFLEVMAAAEDVYGVRPLNVLNIASGPARDVAEYLKTRDVSPAVFTCLESDARAIEHAMTLVRDKQSNVSFRNCNALRWRSQDKYQLIWSAGLFDYFSDDVFVRFVGRLIKMLAHDGELVIGNFSPANASRPYMELVGEWKLVHRSAEHLTELALAAGAAPGSIRVGAEEKGVNLFLHVAAGSHAPRLVRTHGCTGTWPTAKRQIGVEVGVAA